MTFADKLIRLRRKNGMSQEDLANELGVSRQAISKWEGLLSVPDLQNVLKISELFNVSTDYLLKDGIEEENVAEAPCEAVVNTDKEKIGADYDFDEFIEVGAGAKAVCTDTQEDKTEERVALSNKYFTLAGIFMLVSILTSIFSIISAMITHSFVDTTVYFSIAITTVAGILLVLTGYNRTCAAVAICLLTVNSVMSTVVTAINAFRFTSQVFYLITNIIELAFFVMATVEVFTDKKGTGVVKAMIVMPSVCAIINGIIFMAFADWSGRYVQTFPHSLYYIELALIAIALYKERIDVGTQKENLGLAGLTLVFLSISFTLFVSVFFKENMHGLPLFLTYLLGSMLLYTGGYFFLPWLAHYSPKKSIGRGCRERGYSEIFLHIILTCALTYIYHWVWIYRTTKIVRGYNAESKASPGAILALYILVPFFHIYWFKKHGDMIFEEEKKVDPSKKESNSTLFFALLTPFAASVIVQNRINDVAIAKAAAEAVAEDETERADTPEAIAQ